MSIKRRLFASYLVLIFIILAYIGLSSLARAGRLKAEADLFAALELRNEWNALRVRLGDMVVNWDNGATYRAFSSSRGRFSLLLSDSISAADGRSAYAAESRRLLSALAEIWSLADEHLSRVAEAVGDPLFRLVEEAAARRPGLQRLAPLWTELSAASDPRARAAAYLVQRVASEVEFFPIYGDTAENLFSVLVSGAEAYKDGIARAETVVRLLFFGFFLGACLLIAFRFAHALSEPIVSVARRLYDFAGLSGAAAGRPEGAALPARDELSYLSRTVDDLIAHYTELAERAGLLARGEVSEQATFLRGGVVGRSLEEISLYLRELARTSAWIKDGEYGLQIRERSERDVITRNFNVMSAVIREKIETLRGMFESVDEAVLVLDDRGRVLEANGRLRELFGGNGSDAEWSAFLESAFAPALAEAEAGVDGKPASALHLSLRGLRGRLVPARVVGRGLPDAGRGLKRRMYLISDESWRARAAREREKLRGQAAMAELRALRAQINPHFFFNTLNTIAHLAETNRDAAVETIERLAELFRYTLSSTKRESVPLAEELRHVRLFLDIERRRYGEALGVEYDIPDALADRPVPPMLLQPLVENAVRYGADEAGKVRITVSGAVRGDAMVIRVADRGAKEVDLSALLKGRGTGLKNVNQRSLSMYGKRLVFRRNEPRGLVVELRLPAGER